MVFNVALSGIQASTKELDVIGNNIANSATVGFKGSRAEFSDIYTYGAYGSGSTSVGGGVRLSRVHQSFTTGNITASGGAMDMAVNKGTGFFIMNDNGARVYSRAGQFSVDHDRHIVNSSGQRLTGILADRAGQLTGLSGDLRIDEANISPLATSNVALGLNLSTQNVAAPTTDWVGGPTPAVDTYNNPPTFEIFDSLGNAHTLSMYFIRGDNTVAAGQPNATVPANTDNQWYVAFQIDNQDVPAVGVGHNADNLYRINFNSDGSFAGAFDTANAALSSDLIPLSYNLNNGSDPLSLNIDLSNSTQFASPFVSQSIDIDGYTTGSLRGISVDSSGMILGNYSNGKSLAMGQIQLANFSDPEGLQNLGSTSWSETVASGQPLISTPGSGSVGTIASGFVEESNVDLTGELVKLIGAQRNFQANAQTIRTGDAITQTIINIR